MTDQTKALGDPMREAFESRERGEYPSSADALLIRLGKGYENGLVDSDWDDWQKSWQACAAHMSAQIAGLQELEALREDAARYQFLRDDAYKAVVPHGNVVDGSRTAWITHMFAGDTFDTAIDKARALKGEAENGN